MEILDLRHLQSADIEPLLQEENVRWQRDLCWDYTSSATLIRRYVDTASLPGYAVLKDGRLLGFSFFVYENSKGVLGDVFVRDGTDAQEMEIELLSHSLASLRATPGINRVEAQLMILQHQPQTSFFEERSLLSFRRQFMILQLRDAKFTPMPDAPQQRIEPWGPHCQQDAADLIERSYRGHVDSFISDQYRSHNGAIRFLDNIIRYPGCGDFDPVCSFVVRCTDTQRVLGIALSSVVGHRVSHITQICVSPERRHSGIGRRLLLHILETMRKRGTATVTLTVTNSNTSAIRLYEQLGFETLKEFYAFAWEGWSGGRS